jgi:predicted DNA-binding antitoxin AbrB/MazE fold protein
MKEGKTVRLRVKDKVLESINRITSEEESRKESLKILDMPMSDLFEVEK